MKAAKKKKKWGKGRVYRRGGVWWLRWTEDGVRKAEGGHTTEGSASAALDNIRLRIQNSLPGVPERPKVIPLAPMFKDLVDDWFTSREQNDHRSTYDDRGRWRRHLAPKLADRRIDSVTSGDLAQLVRDMRHPLKGAKDVDDEPKRPLSGASAGLVLHLLSSFYRWARVEGYVTANPVRMFNAEMTAKERAQVKSDHDISETLFLENKNDVIRVFKALKEPYNIAFAICALAGLRPGEMLVLEWGDIDFAASKIRVQRQIRHGRVGPPKSGKARDVSMVPGLSALLSAWRQRFPTSVQVVEPLDSKKFYIDKTGKRAESQYLTLKAISRELKAVLALDTIKLPEMSFYSATRHTFGALWILAGLDIYRLSRELGHANVTTTQKHYAHLTRETPAEVLAKADVNLTA